jgi:hypothetical protein
MLFAAVLLSAQLVPGAPGAEYKQPQLAVRGGLAAVTFGAGQTVYFSASRDAGRTFSAPVKISDRHKLALGRHRGPRIAITPGAIVVSAVTGELGGGKDGDLVAWRSTDGGSTWSEGVRINDVVTSAREGLHAMTSTPAGLLYAAWLDLRDKGTRLYGASSRDGGATWSQNALMYASPDGTICECCHPSLASDGKGVLFAMWRNALGGNRNPYLARSSDGGRNWTGFQKLGNGNWELNACPMDGGGLAIDRNGNVTTTWRRQSDIFQTMPGAPEQAIGAGKDPAIAVTRRGVYTVWSTRSGLVARTPDSSDSLPLDAQGAYAQLAALPDGTALAAWEIGGKISFAILK